MSRTVVNFLLDTVLLTVVVALLFTSAVLRFVFPAPTIARGWRLWGHSYDAWANFQFMLLTVVALAVLLHVMLHWSWVCGVIVTRLLRNGERRQKPDEGIQTLWGVGMLIAVVTILGFFVALANLMVEPARESTATDSTNQSRDTRPLADRSHQRPLTRWPMNTKAEARNCKWAFPLTRS